MTKKQFEVQMSRIFPATGFAVYVGAASAGGMFQPVIAGRHVLPTTFKIIPAIGSWKGKEEGSVIFIFEDYLTAENAAHLFKSWNLQDSVLVHNLSDGFKACRKSDECWTMVNGTRFQVLNPLFV